MTSISRRSMIAGFATGVAVAVTPAVVANPAEGAVERVHRLSQELSDALSTWFDGSFRAIVDPAGLDGKPHVSFQSTAEDHSPLPGTLSDALRRFRAADGHFRLLEQQGCKTEHPSSELAVAGQDAWNHRSDALRDVLNLLLQGRSA